MAKKDLAVSADLQADQIEHALAAQGIDFLIRAVDVGARWTIYHGLKPLSENFARVARLADDLALALGVSVVDVVRNGPFVDIRVPRDDADWVLFRNAPPIARTGVAYLGISEAGEPLYVDLTSDEVSHILVAGTTGSGKTMLMRSMILSLAMCNSVYDLTLVLLDPAGAGYAPFRGLPHLARPVLSESGRILDCLAWLVSLVESRRKNSLRLLVFIDELADLCLSAPQAVVPLTRLLQRGRQAGIHVVAATQRPTADVIGGLVKGNFPVRIVGSVASPEDAKIASGLKATGAEKLLGRGDFLVVERSGALTRFQAAYVSEDEITHCVLSLRGGRGVPEGNSDPPQEIEFRKRAGPGRPAMPPTEEEVAVVRKFYDERGTWPSRNWIRTEFGTNNNRAGRILKVAMETIGGGDGEWSGAPTMEATEFNSQGQKSVSGEDIGESN